MYGVLCWFYTALLRCFLHDFVPLWLLRTVPKQVFLRTIDVLEIKWVASIIGSLMG